MITRRSYMDALAQHDVTAGHSCRPVSVIPLLIDYASTTSAWRHGLRSLFFSSFALFLYAGTSILFLILFNDFFFLFGLIQDALGIMTPPMRYPEC